EDVAAGEDRREHLLENLVLADDGLADLGPDRVEHGPDPRELFRWKGVHGAFLITWFFRSDPRMFSNSRQHDTSAWSSAASALESRVALARVSATSWGSRPARVEMRAIASGVEAPCACWRCRRNSASTIERAWAPAFFLRQRPAKASMNSAGRRRRSSCRSTAGPRRRPEAKTPQNAAATASRITGRSDEAQMMEKADCPSVKPWWYSSKAMGRPPEPSSASRTMNSTLSEREIVSLAKRSGSAKATRRPSPRGTTAAAQPAASLPTGSTRRPRLSERV